MPFTIVRQDITKLKTDAIVNAANTELRMGAGVCGAIFEAAGSKQLQAACDALAPVKTGSAAITPGFSLPAKYVIHAVGPIYSHWSAAQSEQLLRAAYTAALTLAKQHDCASIAFPLLSSGIYGYPKEQALAVATDAIRAFLQDCEMEVFLAVFDREAFRLSRELEGSVESYIDEHYVLLHEHRRGQTDALLRPEASLFCDKACPPDAPLSARLCELDEPLSVQLLRLIDEKGKTDVEVYKKANLDRKLFSKIRKAEYLPGKRTLLALAVALELTPEETTALLQCGGYALSHSRKFDVIVEYFIVNGKYDIFQINEVLFRYDQPLLGG